MKFMKRLFKKFKTNFKEGMKKGILTPSCMIPVNF